MKEFRVLIQDGVIPQVALRVIKKTCELVVAKNADEIYDEARNVDGFLSTGRLVTINEEFFAKVGEPLRLKVIALTGVGYEHVDVEAVKKRGIKLSNAAGISNETVAECALGLAIASGRRFYEGHLKIERNEWLATQPQWMLGQDIYGSNFGIVGLGQIGWELAKRVKAFGSERILYTQRNRNPKESELEAEYVSFEELLRQCDFVALCCPLNNQTRHLINKLSLSLMKKTAILINIARGGVVDQEALIEALREKTIAGAGLDVTTPEPLPPNHPLLQLDNCFLTPHIASCSDRTRSTMGVLAVQNILAALNGEQMPTPL